MTLLAEPIDHVRERALVGFGDGLGSGEARRGIHPHVESLIAPEAEPAARRVQLHRRDAQVREHAVDGRDATRIKNSCDVAKIAVHELDPVSKRHERLTGQVERRSIAIDADQPRRPGFEQHPRMAAEADRAVDEESAARRRKVPAHLVDHDGLVHSRHAQRPIRIPNAEC